MPKLTYTLISITKSPDDGKEDVYLYRSAKGDVRFQADPSRAWQWLVYCKASTAPKAQHNRVIDGFVKGMMETQIVPKTLEV